MTKFDEKAISLGLKLNRLSLHPDFEPILTELKDRISEKQDFVLNYRTQKDSTQVLLPTLQAEYRALKDLLDWFEDSIEQGAVELRKKQAAELVALGSDGGQSHD